MHSKIIPFILEIQIFLTLCQSLIGIFIDSQTARSKGQENVKWLELMKSSSKEAGLRGDMAHEN